MRSGWPGLLEFPDKMIQLLSPVLHDPARVGQGNDLSKPMVLVIELLKKLVVFAHTQAERFLPVRSKCHLFLHIVYDVRESSLLEVTGIVIIKIFSVFLDFFSIFIF